MDRRKFLKATVAATAGTLVESESSVSGEPHASSHARSAWQPRYMLASCMYGYMYLGEVLPEVARTGATAIDLWPKRHGNQREQLQDLGEELYLSLLQRHNVTTGCLTQYPLGPFRLTEEMQLAKRLSCSTIVTGGEGPKGLAGDELRNAVRQFTEKMTPHREVAEETGVTIAIENHANNLFDSADSLKYLVEFRSSSRLAVALAPYHLPQDTEQLSSLIRTLGSAIAVFYAWQHGHGCMTRLPKQEELLQLPGRGELDFAPLIKALAEVQYTGWMEIFMHPVPRGIPILETAEEVTAEINRSRDYLTKIVETL